MSQDQDASTYQAHLQAGNALVQQAQKIATQDFEQARAFWQAAGKEFYLAHKADMSEPEAAFRLAQAWMAEALAFDLEPENGRIAMTAASCHLFAGQADAAKAWQLIGKQLLPPEPSEPAA